MGRRRHPAPPFPTPAQELLLRAILLDGDASAAAWRAWRADVDLDRVDEGSRRLLPALYAKRHEAGDADPVLERLKAAYAYTWSRNQLMLQHLAGVLRALHRRGIATLVLKGAALVALHYQDAGCRPMDDVDVLVPYDRAREAMALLADRGWSVIETVPPTAHLRYRHATGFRDRVGRQLDLHWHVMLECCDVEADREFWATAVPVRIANIDTRALDPAAQLLHVCVHGVCSGPTAIRWVADAMTVLRSAPERLDWSRLVDRAARWRLAVTLGAALEYLQEVYGAPIPTAVRDALRDMSGSWLERAEYRVNTSPRAERLLGKLPCMWFQYRRLRAADGGAGPVGGFAGYLRYSWALERPSQLPFHVLRAALRRSAVAAASRLRSLRDGRS